MSNFSGKIALMTGGASVCRTVQKKSACKWCAKIVTQENKPNQQGVVRVIAKSNYRHLGTSAFFRL